MFADSLYKEVWHVCRRTLQSGVACLHNHFTKGCDMFADSLLNTKRCGMFADSLYKEV